MHATVWREAMAGLCRELEQTAVAGPLAPARCVMADFELEHERLRVTLAAYLKQSKNLTRSTDEHERL